MKSRRAFIKTSSLGFLTPSIIHAASLHDSSRATAKSIVRHAGEGEIFIVRENTPITIFISKKTDGVESASLCTEEILPGNGIATHKHMNEDEIFHFVTGTGVFVMDDQETAIMPGTMAFVPRGTWHGLRNTGTELLIFSFGYSPAGFEDFFRQIGTPKGLPFRPKPKEEIMRLANAQGMMYK